MTLPRRVLHTLIANAMQLQYARLGGPFGLRTRERDPFAHNRTVKGRAPMKRIIGACLGLTCIFLFQPAQGRAADVGIELNKLESVSDACRAYLVFENRTDTAFDPFKLDLVMFDGDGVIAKRVAVEAGPLPAGKTSVKLFDVTGLGCANIRRVLLNSVMACDTPANTTPDCTALAKPASRTEAAFIK
jgi:hypothetical protein